MSHETPKYPYVPAKTQKRWPSGRRPVRLVVIHSMEAPEKEQTAENVARYFAQPTTHASAHLCIDSNSTVQCVPDNNIAAAAPGTNTDGIHLELAGYAKQSEAEWLDAYGVLLLNNAALAAAHYCLKYDIQAVHITNDELRGGMKGIIGHYQASEVYRKSTHTDPGPGFPWKAFEELVRGHVRVIQEAEHG